VLTGRVCTPPNPHLFNHAVWDEKFYSWLLGALLYTVITVRYSFPCELLRDFGRAQGSSLERQQSLYRLLKGEIDKESHLWCFLEVMEATLRHNPDDRAGLNDILRLIQSSALYCALAYDLSDRNELNMKVTDVLYAVEASHTSCGYVLRRSHLRAVRDTLKIDSWTSNENAPRSLALLYHDQFLHHPRVMACLIALYTLSGIVAVVWLFLSPPVNWCLGVFSQVVLCPGLIHTFFILLPPHPWAWDFQSLWMFYFGYRLRFLDHRQTASYFRAYWCAHIGVYLLHFCLAARVLSHQLNFYTFFTVWGALYSVGVSFDTFPLMLLTVLTKVKSLGTCYWSCVPSWEQELGVSHR